MSIRIETARREFAEFDEEFKTRRLVDDRFYDELERRGCRCDDCVLVEVFPDGGDTYCGRVIRHDGLVFEFDFDLGEPANSVWRDVTAGFVAGLRQGKSAQPWAREKLAAEAFEQRGGRSPLEEK